MARAAEVSNPSGRSLFTHLGELLWHPTKLFGGFKQSWPWVPAYCVTAVLIAVGTLVSHDSMLTGTLRVLEQQRSPAISMQVAVLAQEIGLLVAPVLSPFISPLVFAYFLLFAGLIVGARVRFGQLFTLTMWASIPSVGLRYLTQGLIHFSHDDVPVYAVDLSLATFLPPELSPILRAAATQLDPFHLWTLALVAVGFAALTRRPYRQGGVLSGLALVIRFGFTLAVIQ